MNKITKFIIIFLVIITVYDILKPFYKLNYLNEGFANDTYKNVKFPFQNILTDKGDVLNIIAITAPFREDKHFDLYQQYKNEGCQFIGISSYLEFPGEIINPHDSKYYRQNKESYFNMVNAWLHCFRFPEKYIPKSFPQLSMSHSDFTNYDIIKPDNSVKEYDIIYICLNDSDVECVEGWQAYNRNWTLAKKCLSLLCETFDLKILIVGRTKCTVEHCNSKITTIPLQNYWDFIKYMNKAKILFVPNISDASPRVITEALCCNLRILVNYSIIGGWKYINENTGEYFNNEDDFIFKLTKLKMDYNNYNPRKWFIDNYGPSNSGKKLYNFVKQHYPTINLNNCESIILHI